MNLRKYWYSGIAAVLIYVFAVVVGGMMYPGYSHVSQDISQLTSTNSPIRDFMNIFFFYNLLVAFFGLGLFRLSEKKISKVASAFVISIGILGIAIAFFPINTRGTAITFTGTVHIAIVSVVVLMTITCGFLFWIGYKNSKFENFAKLSLFTGVAFLVSGPIAAFNVLSPYAGIYERIPIGVFLIWILVSSILFLNSSQKQGRVSLWR